MQQAVKVYSRADKPLTLTVFLASCAYAFGRARTHATGLKERIAILSGKDRRHRLCTRADNRTAWTFRVCMYMYVDATDAFE